MATYRITTDGCKFRIEVLHITMFRKRDKWVPMRNLTPPFGSYVPTFDTEADADTALDKLMHREACRMNGWNPVSNPIKIEYKNI